MAAVQDNRTFPPILPMGLEVEFYQLQLSIQAKNLVYSAPFFSYKNFEMTRPSIKLPSSKIVNSTMVNKIGS